MNVDVRNETAVTGIHPLPDGTAVRLDLRTPAERSSVLARRVVLATGRDGLGGPAVPAFVNALPRSQWAHSSDEMDYGQLAGLRVGVVGAGSSAMDSAGHRAGGRRAQRRAADPPARPAARQQGQGRRRAGPHAGPLRPARRAQVAHPPLHQRGERAAAARQHAARVGDIRTRSSTSAARSFRSNRRATSMRVSTPKGDFVFDFLIVSTGFKVDWPHRPEFDAIAPHVRTWKDRFVPAPGDEDQELADSPDLGPVFEFQQRVAGACPGLDRIHCFCYPAALSHGTVSGDIPAISEGAKRLGERHRQPVLPRRFRAPLREPRGLQRARTVRRRMGARAAAGRTHLNLQILFLFIEAHDNFLPTHLLPST
jgi:cation diffusion facilitator CzcD-associated flavoprotein CzcO